MEGGQIAPNKEAVSERPSAQESQREKRDYSEITKRDYSEFVGLSLPRRLSNAHM